MTGDWRVKKATIGYLLQCAQSLTIKKYANVKIVFTNHTYILPVSVLITLKMLQICTLLSLSRRFNRNFKAKRALFPYSSLFMYLMTHVLRSHVMSKHQMSIRLMSPEKPSRYDMTCGIKKTTSNFLLRNTKGNEWYGLFIILYDNSRLKMYIYYIMTLFSLYHRLLWLMLLIHFAISNQKCQESNCNIYKKKSDFILWHNSWFLLKTHSYCVEYTMHCIPISHE